MRYVASFERIAQRQGIAQGISQGIDLGIGQDQARLLKRQLKQRFGSLPEPLAARVQSATPADLEAWGLRLQDAAGLGDVVGLAGCRTYSITTRL